MYRTSSQNPSLLKYAFFFKVSLLFLIRVKSGFGSVSTFHITPANKEYDKIQNLSLRVILFIFYLYSIEDIRESAMNQNKSFVARSTTPYGIASDFFAASKHHPFLDTVIEALPHSYRWYIIPHFNVLLSTGQSLTTNSMILSYSFQNNFFLFLHFSLSLS